MTYLYKGKIAKSLTETNTAQLEQHQKRLQELEYIRLLQKKGRTGYADCTHAEQRTLLAHHLQSLSLPQAMNSFMYGNITDLQYFLEELCRRLIKPETNDRLCDAIELLIRRYEGAEIERRFIEAEQQRLQAEDYNDEN